MTGHFRYAFDIKELGDGIGIVPVAVGLFGLGEILATPSKSVTAKVHSPKLRELLPSREEWRQSAMPIARGSVLGFIIGIVPGSAHIISSFLSYALEKRHLEDIRRSSARARWRASPARNRPTTRPPPAPSCRCWRSACRPAR